MKKTYGTKQNYKSISTMLTAGAKKPREVRIKVVKSKPKDTGYKIPKTPKVSGKGWGG